MDGEELSLKDLGINETCSVADHPIDYHPTVELRGQSKRAYDTVPDFAVPKQPLRLDTNMPEFVVKVNRCTSYTDDLLKLDGWLRRYGHRVGKMVCIPESRYCMVLTYEKLVGTNYVKTHTVRRLTAAEVNEIDQLANK